MAPTSETSRLLARLTRLRPGPHRIVTCYLKLEPRDRSRGKYLIKLKNRIRRVEASPAVTDLPREEREAVSKDLERIWSYLQVTSQLPRTQGIAIFACGGLRLFEAVALPTVHRSRLAVDRTALVRELASVEDEFGTVLTVVLDRTAARVFEVTAFEAKEVADLRADNTRGGRFHSDRQGAPGRGEHPHHNRIKEEKQRHFDAVARLLFDLDRRKPARGIAIAGPGPEAGALEPFLHRYLADRLMGQAHLVPKEAKPALVHEASLAVRETFERSAERARVRELKEQLGAGWAVNGLRDTLRSLGLGQVRTLLVNADANASGFRCAQSGVLTLSEAGCRGQGDALPVLDVIDDAIEEALRQRVRVEVVHDPEAGRTVADLAAFLRFR